MLHVSWRSLHGDSAGDSSSAHVEVGGGCIYLIRLDGIASGKLKGVIGKGR